LNLSRNNGLKIECGFSIGNQNQKKTGDIMDSSEMNRQSSAFPQFRMLNSSKRKFSLLIPVFGLLLSLFAAGHMAVAEDFEDIYDLASKNFRKGNYQEALPLYKKANKMKSEACIECIWGIAQTYNKLGAYKNVVETCDQLIRLGANEPEYLVKAWNLRGSSLSTAVLTSKSGKDMEKLREAERSFREVLRLSPRSSIAHYSLGLVLIWSNRTDEGITELRAYVNSGEQGESVEKARKILANPARAAENFAPDFSFVTAEGEYLSSEDLRGKVILLDFWGTWCGPCRDAVPYLTDLNKKYSQKAFVLISVDSNDEESVWREYIAKNKMNWTHMRDADGKIRRLFQVNAFPTYILIDHEGIILSRNLGGGYMTESAVESAVKKATKVVAAKPAVTAEKLPAFSPNEPLNAAPSVSAPATPVAATAGPRVMPPPAIPRPKLLVMFADRSRLPEAMRAQMGIYQLQIKNWASMPDALFETAKDLPPCRRGMGTVFSQSSSNPDAPSSRFELTVFNDREESVWAMCGVPRPEILENIMLTLPQYRLTENIHIQIKDRLTGHFVQSDSVPLPASSEK
jgi:thiol-disulfide isomerase/thioredoxin